MFKFRLTNPLNQTAFLMFEAWDQVGVRVDAPLFMGRALDLLVGTLIGYGGKSLSMEILTARDLMLGLSSKTPEGWSFELVEGVIPETEPFSESLEPEKDGFVIPAEEVSAENQNVFDDAAGAVASDFHDKLYAAQTFSELQSVFMEAVDAMRERLEAQGISYGVAKGQARAAREKINAEVTKFLDERDPLIPLSSSERELLAQYSGRGGLSENSVTEYYTPQHVAESKWEMLAQNGFAGGSVGEFSCGTGVMLGTKPKNTKMVACELSNISSQCAQLLHPEDDVQNTSFEEMAASMPDNSLDAVIGNAPFSDSRTEKRLDPAYAKRNLTLEQYFVLRSIDKVRHGGPVCLILPTRVISRESKGFANVRREISMKAEFLGAVRLPSNTFKVGQHGTNVPVDVILLKKHPKDLAEKIQSLGVDVLTSSNVLFNDFIEGKWFKTEGRKYVLGEESREGPWNRLKVSFDGSEEERERVIRNVLGQKFDSRIDWDALESAPVSPPVYGEGDSLVINGQNHVLEGGRWRPQQVVVDVANLDPAEYGADSLEGLLELLRTPEGCMKLTVENMRAINLAFPRVLEDFELAVRAWRFAEAQSGPLQTIAWRGSLLGQRLTKFQVDSRKGDTSEEALELIQAAVGSEIDKYNNPQKIRGLDKKGNYARDWLMYESAIDSQTGAFSDLLQGEYDASGALSFDSGSITSIIRYLTAQTITLEVHADDVLALYKGLPEMSDIYDVIRDEGVALTNSGNLMLIEHYMSGDIYQKLAQLNQQIERASDMRFRSKFVWQRDYILKNRPFTKLNDIDVSFSDKWINKDYVQEFLEFAGYDFYFDEESGFWESTEKVELFDGQLLKYLNRGYVLKGDEFVKVTGGAKLRGQTAEATEEYREQLADLEIQFNDYLRAHDDSSVIEEQYNAIFNSHMPVTHSEAPLNLKNLSGDIAPHGFQNQTIRRMSDDGKGIIGFDVGLGKTFTALSLVEYNHENNRTKRSAITVPKAVLANWYHEARKLLKSLDHYLFVGLTPEKDKGGNVLKDPVLDQNGKPVEKAGVPVMQDRLIEDSADEIRRKMWLIPQTNKRTVVMSIPQFSRIPLKPDTMSEYTEEMVKNEMMSDGTASEYLMSAVGYSAEERAKQRKENSRILDAKNEAKKKKSFTYLQAQKTERWKEKYSDDGTAKRQDYPFYEDMGFDSVVVDEAHYFKNVYEVKEERGLKYLSATGASQRGTDMAIKMNFMKKHNKGRGPYMLTATPLTNSPIEVYNALSLVTDMSELERMGVKSPDDFIRIFAKKGTVEVQKLSGEIATTEGIVGFKNLKALRNLFNRFADVKSAEDVEFDSGIAPPEAVETHATVDLNEEQQLGYEGLRDELAASIAAMGGGPQIDMVDGDGNPLPQPRPIFSIMRDMERLTTDIDLYFKQMTWRFPAEMEAKVKELVSKGIPKSVTGKRYDPVEEKQISMKVERPDSIEVKRSGALVQFRLPVEFEEHVLKRLSQGAFKDLKENVSHPISGKYAELLGNVNRHIAEGGKQIIFTEEKSEHGKLLRILTANTEISEDQIAIINASTAGDPDKLQTISDMYNRGDYKIVIANQKAEVGVNLQKGTSAIHHLTLPWTPASIQQRNGRGVRQGNTRTEVDVYYYVAKGSLDINRLDALKAKANWINQVMKSDDARMENPDAAAEASAEIIKAVLGEEAYTEKLAKERAIKEEKQRVRAEKTAINTLSALAQAAREKTRAVYLIEKRFKDESIKWGYDKSEYGRIQKVGYSLSEIDKALADMEDGTLRKSELTEMRDKALADIQASEERSDRKINRHKAAIEKMENTPFDKKVLNDPSKVFTPRNTRLAIYEGAYIDVIPLSRKGWSTTRTGVYRVERVDFASEEIRIKRISGDYHVANELKGNSRHGENVPFSKWPPEWKPVSMTPQKELEFAIKEHTGTLSSFLAKWDEQDIRSYALAGNISSRSTGYYGSNIATYLLCQNSEGYYLKYVSGQYNFTSLDELVFPNPNNSSLKSEVISLAKEQYGFQDGQFGEGLKDLLSLYLGGDYEAEYRASFKEKDAGEAMLEYTRRLQKLVKSAPEEFAGNPISLWTWLDEPDSQFAIERDKLLMEYSEEGYENTSALESELRKIQVIEEKKYRDLAVNERQRLDEIEAEKARIQAEKEAAEKAEIEAAEKAEKLAKLEAENKRFSEEGGAQLSPSQVAEFNALGFTAQIITSEWEYPEYKSARGRKVRGFKFPAGRYLRLEGATLRAVFKKGNNDSVNDRFASSHADKTLYKYPRIMTTYIGHEGEEICLTPISNVAEDVEFYLDLIKG